ncbi:S1/P1 nuclease, partial [Oleiagrimonas sp.]|uniref:S1/P1 nuclease n=1 Tax=Oleiagrimonas sp. TaxID=2010330 RepID=UPI002621A092
MPRKLRLLPILAILVLISPVALAWGPEGHAIIAEIAQRHLDPAAAQEVHQLLALEGKTRLDQVSSWPDQIRKDHPETGPWHYVDTPLRAPRYNVRRDCPQGNCVVRKLPHFAHVLANRKASPQARLEALKWVVHLVGDIHQPMHNDDHDDKGGKTVKLVYFGHPTNLHRMWDTNILEHHYGLHMGPHYSFDRDATRAIAARMNASIGAARLARWTPPMALQNIAPEAVRWSDHSHALARKVAYGDLPDRRREGWSVVYQAKAWPVVRNQIEAAGVR